VGAEVFGGDLAGLGAEAGHAGQAARRP
jgi:hypothetical protein